MAKNARDTHKAGGPGKNFTLLTCLALIYDIAMLSAHARKLVGISSDCQTVRGSLHLWLIAQSGLNYSLPRSLSAARALLLSDHVSNLLLTNLFYS